MPALKIKPYNQTPARTVARFRCEFDAGGCNYRGVVVAAGVVCSRNAGSAAIDYWFDGEIPTSIAPTIDRGQRRIPLQKNDVQRRHLNNNNLIVALR